MKQVIYIDVLIFINVFISFFILLSTKLALHKFTPVWRIVLGSVIGGAFSLMIFAPPLKTAIMILIKVLFMVLVSFIGFKIEGIKDFIRTFLVFILINFIFAGIMFGIKTLLNPYGMQYNNLTIYFDINIVSLILLTILSYIIISVISWLLKRKAPQNSIYEIKVILDGKEVNGYAFTDSGNMLKDAFSDTPVAICDFDFIKPLFSKEMVKMFDSPISYIENTEAIKDIKIRYIPFNDISGKGLLPAFMPDKFSVKSIGNKWTDKKVYLAVRKGKIAEGEYTALLSPQIFNDEMEKKNEKVFRKNKSKNT